jgi:hypothetical protein
MGSPTVNGCCRQKANEINGLKLPRHPENQMAAWVLGRAVALGLSPISRSGFWHLAEPPALCRAPIGVLRSDLSIRLLAPGGAHSGIVAVRAAGWGEKTVQSGLKRLNPGREIVSTVRRTPP